MPYTKRYLGSIKNHFNTIGVIGGNEACLNLINKDIGTKEGKELILKVLNHIRELIVEFQEETKNLYNLEASPGEGTTYRLARIDKKQYPDIKQSGTEETPYYTNSTQLPVGHTEDIIEAIIHQEELQGKYTGGTVLHMFVGERISDWINCMTLVRKIANKTKIPYFTITPTFSICPVHGYISGEHKYCPLDHTVEEKQQYGIYTGGTK